MKISTNIRKRVKLTEQGFPVKLTYEDGRGIKQSISITRTPLVAQALERLWNVRDEEFEMMDEDEKDGWRRLRLRRRTVRRRLRLPLSQLWLW